MHSDILRGMWLVSSSFFFNFLVLVVLNIPITQFVVVSAFGLIVYFIARLDRKMG